MYPDSSSTQGSSVLKRLQSMRCRARQWREICSVRPPRCAAILVYLSGERLDTRFRHRIKISGFTHPHAIGFVADLFFSGFAVEFAGYVWTVAVSGKKKLRIRKYPDTCGRGLNQI